ncbi:DUF1772 domain-containing protein [Paenibacillus sp. P26]|nr:DUF1772 domain-containing protein [Paenibacillus sp. P26]UUZ94531.1 DUF1772 domain-containing protein [Paenibacillus sp. P25]
MGEAGALYQLTGSLLLIAGSFLVTVMLSVPLNDRLASVEPGSLDGARLWAQYVVRWTAWNHVRTISALAALLSFILALRQIR